MGRFLHYLTHLLAIFIVVLLWALWPSGQVANMAADAASSGISADTIRAYEAASPVTALPMPAILWAAAYICCCLLGRVGLKNRFSDGLASSSEIGPPRYAEDYLAKSDEVTSRISSTVADDIFETNYSRPAGGTARQSFYQRVAKQLVGFGMVWASLGALQWVFGSPLLTGDSIVYLRGALSPWSQFGGHHPSGSGWLLWLGKQLGFAVGATLTAVGAIEISIIQQVVRRNLGAGVAWAAAAAFMLYPDFLLIRLSLWSEPGMLLLISILIFVLAAKRSGVVSWCAGLVGLFLVMSEMRHAAIFLLPALVISVSACLRLFKDWKRAGISICTVASCFLGGWMLVNMARTGKPLAPATGSFECVHFIAAYHRVPFCSTAPGIALCQMDLDGAWLKQGLGNNPDFISLDRFIFRPDSPLNRLALNSEGLCELWRSMRSELIANYKVETARLLASRTAGQFGWWQISERGANLRKEGVSGALAFLDAALAACNSAVWVLWSAWAVALLNGIRTRRVLNPVVLFCLLGGLGHAAGIAVNNPFLGLRYLAISKYLVSFAAVLMIGRRRS
jgi:hypothetical protein